MTHIGRALPAAGVGTAAAALLFALISAPAAEAAPAVAGEFSVSGVGANNQVALGPDGNMWVTLESATNDIARITPDGTVTEYNPANVTNPVGIAAGPDGKMWVTQANEVASFTPADPNSATKTAVAALTDPRGITAGPDNSMWTGSGDKLIKIPVANPAGFTAFAGTGLVGARATVAGGDGNLWVADFGGAQVISIPPAGTPGTKYATGGGPQGIAPGPSGSAQIGYTNQGTNPHTIGRIEPGGAPQTTDVPLADPFGMALGPDGAYWSANFAENTVGRLTTDGAYTKVTGFSAAAGPRQLAAGPDNTLWVTLDTAEKVAKVTGVTAPTPTPSTSTPAATPTATPTSSPSPSPSTGPQAKKKARVKARPVAKSGKLKVRVRPKLAGKQWRFKVHKRIKQGKWITLGAKHRTHGSSKTAVIDLGPGRYKVRVPAQKGYRAGVSKVVRLRR